MKHCVQVLEKDNVNNGFIKRFLGKERYEFLVAASPDEEFNDADVEIKRQDLTEEYGFEEKEDAAKLACSLNTRDLNNSIISVTIL